MNKSMRRSSVSNNTWYKSLSAGNTPLGTYEHIATLTASSAGVSVLSFTSIPQGYGHLQVRYTGKVVPASPEVNLLTVRLNNISSSIYSNSSLEARSTIVAAFNKVATTSFELTNGIASAQTGGRSSLGVIDILDYANPLKNTTIRALYLNAFSNTPLNPIVLAGGLLNNTESINSITFEIPGTSFSTLPRPRFSLYGIRNT